MVNRDCESFGKYRIIKCFIHQSASLYTAILQNFGLRVFFYFGLHTFLFGLQFWLDSTLKLYHDVAVTCKYIPRYVHYKTDTRPYNTSETYSRTAIGEYEAACRNLARSTWSRSRKTKPRRPCPSPPQYDCSADRACPATRRSGPARSSWATCRGRQGYVAPASCRTATTAVKTGDAAAGRWVSWRAGRESVRRAELVCSESSAGHRLHGTAVE